MEEKIQIVIDGPAGAGKSTVAKALAKRLGILYLDTGAMYRSIAYKALRQKINIDNEEEISKLAQNTDIEFDHSEESRVYCDGEDVTKEIRSPDVSRVVSIIATYPDVRKRLVELQRREGERGSIVMDGRDIGTYVLPQADLKIFLTASVSERAKRRYEELKLTGKNVSLEEVLEDVEKRDQRDRDREVSPLKPAPDAWILDTSNLTVDEIIEKILARLGKIRG